MNQQNRHIVDEAVSVINEQAEEYKKRLDAQARRVKEYAQLAKRDDLRKALELIVDHGMMQKESLTRPELVNNISFALTMLFTDPFTGQVKIPLDFWQKPLGRLINTANLRHTGFTDALNPTEAAKEANVSRQTIYRWIEQGKILPLWQGAHLFILRLELLVVTNRMGREAQSSDIEAEVSVA